MLSNLIFLGYFTSIVLAIPRPTVEGGEVSEDVCLLPPTTGKVSCRPSIFLNRWTYNAKTQDCERIAYSGCFGTANLFRNQYACLAKCNVKGLQKLISEGDASSQCLLPLVIGACKAQIPSYYFEPTTGVCTFFGYGGCDGNANNFETLADCENSCYGPDSLFDQSPSSFNSEPPKQTEVPN